MFNPAQITTYISLAAAGIWAICYVRNSKKIVVLATLAVTLGALGSSAYLEAIQHVDPCANAPALQLNEVCAEGKECEGRKDFVEIYNPTSSDVSLACYAIGDQRSVRGSKGRIESPPRLLAGEIKGQGVRAWNEDQLGVRLSKEKGDLVGLYKVRLVPGKHADFDLIEQVVVSETKSYWYRSPDGAGRWEALNHLEVKAKGLVGSFDRPNLPN